MVTGQFNRAKRLLGVGAGDNAEQCPNAPPWHHVDLALKGAQAFVEQVDGGNAVAVEPAHSENSFAHGIGLDLPQRKASAIRSSTS